MGKRVGIVGTRFSELHSPEWRFHMKEIIDGLPPDTLLVVNGAPGADQEALRLAEERGLQVEVLFKHEDFADHSSTFIRRNAAIVDQVEELYAVWDGVSPGTLHAITLAKHKGVPVHVVNALDSDWQRFS